MNVSSDEAYIRSDIYKLGASASRPGGCIATGSAGFALPVQLAKHWRHLFDLLSGFGLDSRHGLEKIRMRHART